MRKTHKFSFVGRFQPNELSLSRNQALEIVRVQVWKVDLQTLGTGGCNRRV